MYITNREVGKRIHEYRKQEGLRQKDLAQELEYSEDYISKIERGDIMPSLRALSGMKNKYNWDIDYIFSGCYVPVSPFESFYKVCDEDQRYEMTECILWVLRNSSILEYEPSGNSRKVVEIIEYVNRLNKSRKASIYTNYSKEMTEAIESDEKETNRLFENSVLYGLRKTVQKSQGYMAKNYGVRTKRYLDVENGVSTPDIQMMNSIYEKYHVNPNYLISGKTEEMAELTILWNTWSEETRRIIYHQITSGFEYMMDCSEKDK